MPGFTVRAREKGPGPPSSTADHVGEIDTAAPIQSVKAAVTLFSEVGPFRSRPVPRRSDSENDQSMLRELDRCKDHLKSVETAKDRAFEDLKTANRALQELTRMLDSLSERKQASIKAVAHLDSIWKDELENERESCKALSSQLIARKEELADLREDFEAALELKRAASQKAEEARRKIKTDQERLSQLENEVETIRKMLSKLNETNEEARALKITLESKNSTQSSINKLLVEAEQAIRDAEESKKKAEMLKKETEASRLVTEEAEEKLKAALEEADRVYKRLGPSRKIRMSAEEFESMNEKIKGFESEADVKVAIAKAQKETISTREKAISKKLANLLKENEALETRIKDAMKRAMMAEAARSIVETELRKWRQNECNKSSAK